MAVALGATATLALPSVYVYEMPARFNEDVLRAVVVAGDEWWHPTPAMLLNRGFGPRLDVGVDDDDVDEGGLYDSFPYALELVLHQRLLAYSGRVHDPADADLLWVPFYPTLSAIAHRKDRRALAENERAALRWLREHAPRFSAEPHRHALALGKVPSEHLGEGSALYGSRWLLFRELASVNVLAIESDGGSQRLCAESAQMRATLAAQALGGFSRRQLHEPMAPLSDAERAHAADLALVLAQPDGERARAIDVCLVRHALRARELSAARVWAIPYNGVYAYEGEPNASSARTPPVPTADGLAPWPADAPFERAARRLHPWEHARPRTLLATFVGAERRNKLGLYVPQRVAAVQSCRAWAERVAKAAELDDGGEPGWRVRVDGRVDAVEPDAAPNGQPPRARDGGEPRARGGMSAARMPCVVEPRTDRRRIRHLYSRAVFCLQPPGDTATRSGIFDSIVSGCVPVLWSNETLAQYELHLPEPERVAVVVPAAHDDDALPWLAALLDGDAPRVERMREAIARVAPRCQYSLLGGRPAGTPAGEPWDALEHALAGIAARRCLRRSGRTPGT